MVGYLCAIIHITRFPRESNFLASCSLRRHWRAEARRARVASRGAAEALCWARRSRLHASLTRKHQPQLTSETMDAGVHVKATRGRERRTRLGVLSGFRSFYCCLSACVPSIPHFTSIIARGKSQSNVHTHWCQHPSVKNVGFGDFKNNNSSNKLQI